jgi:ubiquinone/menaquinone biosynthesis C-methylase UbiE
MGKSRSEMERLENERAFHNVTFAEDLRAGVGKFYATIPEARAHYSDLILSDCAGRNILEYGCGPGSSAFRLAFQGANVLGIDISDVAIDLAREHARSLGVPATFSVMNAEALELPDRSMDRIVGSGIIHHLDIERAYGEVARCLKSDGVGVFIEPMGHHPLVNLFRKLTPRLRTVDEHPLVMSDLRLASNYFHSVTVRYFNVFAMGAALVHGTFLFRPMLAVLLSVDRALLSRIPGMRRWAWICVIELREPRT